MELLLAELLSTANLVFREGASREEIAALAVIFSDDLAGEKPCDIRAAFALHRRRSRYFPTPADILRLLPECRTGASVALPAIGEGEGLSGEEVMAMYRDWKASRGSQQATPRGLARPDFAGLLKGMADESVR